MHDLNAFIDRLPKAELHLHIEGSLEPEQMFAFAQRNGVSLRFQSVDEIRRAYAFSNLQEFLDLYYEGMRVLLTRQDFYELTSAYLRRAHADSCRHVEIFFDPQGHTERGVAFAEVIEGILAALADGEAELGITSGLILSVLRHLSEDSALETLAMAEPWLDRIVGIGLDSSEVGHPPSKFVRVYDQARAKGLKLVAHAGEEGPPAYVREALDLLGAHRIDHGNRALEDEALVDRLVRDGVPLTVCPLSNLKLCVVDDLRNHPLRRMLHLGIKATVNSDDPSYFRGYVNENYRRVAAAVGLTRAEIAQLARNSIIAAFITPDRKAALLHELETYCAGFPA